MPFLNFKGKTAVETHHHSLPHHTLDFAPDLSILDEGQEPSLDGNLIIEGDNLIALKALLPTHAGRIKCVTIDPPYNTGNEGWVYNDNLTQPQFKEWIGKEVGKEAEDACRHDKWCCMMYPRLMLLRELLRNDGVLFVTIDDNEVHHLRVIMDEIFGPENFVANVVWQKKYAVSSDAKGIPPMHDHILVYQRSSAFIPNMLARTDKQDAVYKNPDNDPRGLWRPDNLLRSEYRERDFYKITSPLTGKEFWPPEGSSWRHPQTVIEKMIADSRIWFGEHGNNRPVPKRFLAEVRQGITASAWWPHNEVGHNDESKKELQELFGGESPFPTPKPTRLIKRILELATGGDDLVLDSFAGSGTTAQAVLEANREDGSDRKFILIQQKQESNDQAMADTNICQAITAERVCRVILGYSFQGNHVETLLEEKVGLNSLKSADALLARIEAARQDGQARYDQVRAEMKDGVVRVEGVAKITEHKPGLGGSFTYARLSDKPLFGEFKDLGDNLPAYEELARYIYFTETSRQWAADRFTPDTGKIGEYASVSYYLLYRPNHEEDWGMDLSFLKVAAADPNKTIVVYCEMLRVHRDDLRRWQNESGKTIRSMIVPYNLK